MAFGHPEGHESRKRVRAWAAVVAARLRDLGLSVDDSAAASDGGADHRGAGGARVVVARIEAEGGRHPSRGRAAERRGARDLARADIVLTIDDARVEVAAELTVAAVSVERARAADPVRALELTTALEALPEQFAIGIAGHDERAPASRATSAELYALFDQAVHEQRPLWLGWSLPREVAIAHAALLEEQLEDAVVALGATLAVLSSQDGAAAAAARTGRGQRHKHRRTQADDEGRGAKRRGRDREDEPDRSEEPAAEAEPRESEAPHRFPQRPPKLSSKVRGGVRAPRRSETAGVAAAGAAPFEKGAKVRVLEGPFSGKVGVVQELDGKGGVRVMLGLLAVRLDVRDLARYPENRSRPMLSSSHRKPPLVRS
ncbi:MAG TPA: KOW motif-containing protein [Polyangiaceae bacterium]